MPVVNPVAKLPPAAPTNADDDYTFTDDQRKAYLELENAFYRDNDDGFGDELSCSDYSLYIIDKLKEVNARLSFDPVPVESDRIPKISFKDPLVDLVVPLSPLSSCSDTSSVHFDWSLYSDDVPLENDSNSAGAAVPPQATLEEGATEPPDELGEASSSSTSSSFSVASVLNGGIGKGNDAKLGDEVPNPEQSRIGTGDDEKSEDDVPDIGSGNVGEEAVGRDKDDLVIEDVNFAAESALPNDVNHPARLLDLELKIELPTSSTSVTAHSAILELQHIDREDEARGPAKIASASTQHHHNSASSDLLEKTSASGDEADKSSAEEIKYDAGGFSEVPRESRLDDIKLTIAESDGETDSAPQNDALESGAVENNEGRDREDVPPPPPADETVNTASRDDEGRGASAGPSIDKCQTAGETNRPAAINPHTPAGPSVKRKVRVKSASRGGSVTKSQPSTNPQADIPDESSSSAKVRSVRRTVQTRQSAANLVQGSSKNGRVASAKVRGRSSTSGADATALDGSHENGASSERRSQGAARPPARLSPYQVASAADSLTATDSISRGLRSRPNVVPAARANGGKAKKREKEREEDEQRRRRCEAEMAFQAWLVAKKRSGAIKSGSPSHLARNRPPNATSTAASNDQREAVHEGSRREVDFHSWLRKKEEQKARERLTKQLQEQELRAAAATATPDPDAAFKRWLREKKKQARTRATFSSSSGRRSARPGSSASSSTGSSGGNVKRSTFSVRRQTAERLLIRTLQAYVEAATNSASYTTKS